MVPHSKLAYKFPNNPLSYRGTCVHRRGTMSVHQEWGYVIPTTVKMVPRVKIMYRTPFVLFYLKQFKAEYTLILTGNV